MLAKARTRAAGGLYRAARWGSRSFKSSGISVLPQKSCQRVHGAISEIDLRPVSHSFSKASKRRNDPPRLDFIKRHYLGHSSSTRWLNEASAVSPSRALRTMPASRSDTDDHFGARTKHRRQGPATVRRGIPRACARGLTEGW